jgi:hypothetical protein
MSAPSSLEYGTLAGQHHPEYDPNYWARCRALYSGGKALLQNPAVLAQVMPKMPNEERETYQLRQQLAYYLNYSGAIIDIIVAELFQERLALSGDPELPPFYDKFVQNVAPAGSSILSLNDFLRRQTLTALQCQRAWTLIDLPRPPASGFLTRGEEEASGQLRACATAIEPECIQDWHMNADGRLDWALLHWARQDRLTISDSREWIIEEFKYYDRESWGLYRTEPYKADHPPREHDIIPAVDGGALSFGQVPLIPLELSEGLWAMGKLESIARAHMNKRCGLTWAMRSHCYPILAFFGGKDDPLNPLQTGANRAVEQVYGPGRLNQFGAEDRLEFVAPPADTYALIAQDLKDLRDEMYRVTHHMAMSVDNSAAALQRSAASKQTDRISTCIVLAALGKYMSAHVGEMIRMIAAGRKDANVNPVVTGMEEYESEGIGALLEQAQIIELVGSHSPTFRRKFEFMWSKQTLGDDASEEDLESVRNDLEKNISDEELALPPPAPFVPGARMPKQPQVED